MKFCMNCGKQVEEGSYCGGCGTQLEKNDHPRTSSKRKKVLGISLMTLVLLGGFLFYTTMGKNVLGMVVPIKVLPYVGVEEGTSYKLKQSYGKEGEMPEESISTYTSEGIETIDGHSVYKLKSVENGSNDIFYSLFSTDTSEGIKEIGVIDDGDIHWTEDPDIFFPEKMKVGKKYVYRDETSKREITLDEIKTITIDGKTFENCLVFKTNTYFSDGEDTSTFTSYYAKGIGLVKSQGSVTMGDRTYYTEGSYTE
ncbi:hypothetical protein LCM10_09415 [Rossellomorea aquimaris]|uniref:hypothetical protein n=1 Tax=Rossellomorea aquimaris TaxID=189382 RepID=UPI001CD20FD0|nr:hypothetical protein [Rossellomorea aquimaris]MCA1055205.1 hypothetical protein [Rossellomorea aquimaris]